MTPDPRHPFTGECTPGDAEWLRRRDWFLSQPDDGWWWLSFCDTDRPDGEKFLGLCIVPGGNLVQACNNAWTLGINPGGQVAGFELHATPRAEFVARFYARGAPATVMAEMEPGDLFEPGT